MKAGNTDGRKVRNRTNNPLYNQPNGYNYDQYRRDRALSLKHEIEHREELSVSPEYEAYRTLLYSHLEDTEPEEAERYYRLRSEALKRYEGDELRGGKSVIEALETTSLSYHVYFTEYYELSDEDVVNKILGEIEKLGIQYERTAKASKIITEHINEVKAYRTYLELIKELEEIPADNLFNITPEDPQQLAEFYAEDEGEVTRAGVLDYVESAYSLLNAWIEDQVYFEKGALRWAELNEGPYSDLADKIGLLISNEVIYGQLKTPLNIPPFSNLKDRSAIEAEIIDRIIAEGKAEEVERTLNPIMGQPGPYAPEILRQAEELAIKHHLKQEVKNEIMTHEYLKIHPPGPEPSKYMVTHGPINLFGEKMAPASYVQSLDRWIIEDAQPMTDAEIPYRFLFPQDSKKKSITEDDRTLLSIISSQQLTEHPDIFDTKAPGAFIEISENEIIRRWYGEKDKKITNEDRTNLFNQMQSLLGVLYEADYTQILRTNENIRTLLHDGSLTTGEGVPLLYYTTRRTLNNDGSYTIHYRIPLLPATEYHDLILGQYRYVPVKLRLTPKLILGRNVMVKEGGKWVDAKDSEGKTIPQIRPDTIKCVEKIQKDWNIDLLSDLEKGTAKGLYLERNKKMGVLENVILKTIAYGNHTKSTKYTLNTDTIIRKVWPEGLSDRQIARRKLNILKFLLYQVNEPESMVQDFDLKKNGKTWRDIEITYRSHAKNPKALK